jgi:hypothetical protein
MYTIVGASLACRAGENRRRSMALARRLSIATDGVNIAIVVGIDSRHPQSQRALHAVMQVGSQTRFGATRSPRHARTARFR